MAQPHVTLLNGFNLGKIFKGHIVFDSLEFVLHPGVT